MPRLEARPATFADLRRFYPDERCSFRAWVAELDGEPQGIIGLAMTRPHACMFSRFEPELRPHLKSLTVLRLIKKAEAAVRASKAPVLALAEPTEPTAPKMLERIGFTHFAHSDDGEIYSYKGAA